MGIIVGVFDFHQNNFDKKTLLLVSLLYRTLTKFLILFFFII